MIGWSFLDPGPNRLRDLLEQMASEQRGDEGQGAPMPINVWDDGSSVVIEAALPGVSDEDVEVSGVDGILTIEGRSSIPQRRYLHQELSSVRYLRQIALPGDCRLEAAEASTEQGVLTVRVPRAKPRAPKPIRIQVNKRGSLQTTIEAERGDGYSDISTTRTTRRVRPRSI